MKIIRFLGLIASLLLGMFMAQPASAQQIGQCVDQTRGQSFAVYANLWIVQIGNPANQSQAVRDPSGMTFMRVAAWNPTVQAFFVDWNGRIIEINPNGWFPVGYCQFSANIIPPNPYNFQYQPPQMAQWGIRGSNGVVPVPQAFADSKQRYVAPLYATAQTAQSCLDSSGADRDQFGDCMLRSMLGQKENKIYECSKEGRDNTGTALCILTAVGGEKERRAASQVGECYSKHQSEWDQYPLCMANQNLDGDAAKLLNCVRKQSEAGDASFFGTAVCYGAQNLRLNPEHQIAIECAASSGGEPIAFAGCTGGRLTARELTKCLTVGVGGDGCFGPNNEIVKALRSVGVNLNDALGPNNDLVKSWNNGVRDIQHGPGPNNEVVKAFQTVGNDIAHGPGQNNDLVKAIDNVIPGFSSWF